MHEAKVAVVTGGGSGIGLATCRRLLADGYNVAALDRRIDGLAEKLGAPTGRALVCIVDVTHSAQLDEAMRLVDETFSRLDLLVTAAGIAQPSSQAFGEFGADILSITDHDFDEVVRVNLHGTFYAIRAAVPLLRRNGARGGSIVTISSVGAIAPFPLTAPYPAAKAGVLGMTRAIAALLAPENIRINALAPGAVDTPMLALNGEEARAKMTAMSPLGRAAAPEEMAATIAFLAGDEASFFTGQTISQNGGYVM